MKMMHPGIGVCNVENAVEPQLTQSQSQFSRIFGILSIFFTFSLASASIVSWIFNGAMG